MFHQTCGAGLAISGLGAVELHTSATGVGHGQWRAEAAHPADPAPGRHGANPHAEPDQPGAALLRPVRGAADQRKGLPGGVPAAGRSRYHQPRRQPASAFHAAPTIRRRSPGARRRLRALLWCSAARCDAGSSSGS